MQESENSTPTPTIPPSGTTYAYTHLQADGNRILSGSGAIDDVAPVDITVEGQPAWVLAFGDSASYWTIVTTAGVATTHRISDGTSERVQEHGQVSNVTGIALTENRVAVGAGTPDRVRIWQG